MSFFYKPKHSRAKPPNKPISHLQCYLTVLYVVAFLISNVLAARQVQGPFNLVLTGTLFVFPITYILSDLFSEVYGYAWSRKTCYMALMANFGLVLVGWAIISLPHPAFFEGNEAYRAVLLNSFRVFIGSSLAFVIGDFMNDRVFHRMKQKHRNSIQGFSVRALVSSTVGELFDSFIFFPIAFLGQMPWESILWMILIEIVLKVMYEVLILPVTIVIVKKVSKVEGKTV